MYGKENKPYQIQDTHCIARMMQAQIFQENSSLYSGCYYCKYQIDCFGDKGDDVQFNNIDISKLRKKFEDATGVYLGLLIFSPLKMNFFNESFADNYPERYEELIEKRDKPFSDELDFTSQEIIDLKRPKK